jgi:hypothetical protein
MTNLSPAAQAVLDAANNELDHAPWDVSYLAKPAVAAALRAVADEVVDAHDGFTGTRIHASIHAIAAELEALPND